MTGFENNIPINVNQLLGKTSKEKQVKPNLNNDEQSQQLQKSGQQVKNTPQQSLVNTNSNVNINQKTLTSPVVNQAALNSSNAVKTPSEVKNNQTNQAQPTPAQADFKGASDLPAYAGVANMSFKSWVAGNDRSGTAKLDAKSELASLLEAIKGFERKNYEEDSDGLSKKLKDAKRLTRRNLILLSHVFASTEQFRDQETDFIIQIANFKKLGKNRDGKKENKVLYDLKNAPPSPSDVDKVKDLKNLNAKHLHELFALPKEFPEALRLLAHDDIEINSQYLKSFLMQRLKIVQGEAFKSEGHLSNAIQSFVSLMGEENLLLPLVLLYYPLPFPALKPEFNFVDEWKASKGSQAEKQEIASCEIYYMHKKRGRFLVKVILGKGNELSVDVQTAKENNGIVKDIEMAVSEGMYLLESPPKLSDLNVLLCGEIYKATDYDEELSIVSSGPLRLEIVLAVYSTLIVLNKLNTESDPAGLIEMTD